MLNPKDIFEQIGFIIDSPSKHSSYKSKGKTQYYQKPFQFNLPNKYKTTQHEFIQPQYTTSLEIQLGQDENHILQIKSYDDPFQLAINFCRKHNLNQLAVQIVQKKIIQAKQRQSNKLVERIHQQIQQVIHQSSPYKQKNPRQKIQQNNCNQQFLVNKPYQNKISQAQSYMENRQTPLKSVTPKKNQNRKSLVSKSKGKSTNKINQKSVQKPKNKQNKQTKTTVDKACQNLYFRGILQTKALQQKRIKRQQQLQKKEQQELTFKPKINQVSQKIIQFRKQTGTVPIKSTNKIKKQLTQQYYKQLQECTFTPQINPISKIIVHNRQAYRNQDQHFNFLFNNTIKGEESNTGLKERKSLNSNFQSRTLCNKKSKQYLLKKKQQQEKQLFHPKLNPKSIQQVRQPFNVRLSRAIQNKQKIKDGQYKNDQYTFQPQVGRSPFYQQSRGNQGNNKQNIPVWEQLYKQSQIRAKNKQKEYKSKQSNTIIGTHANTSQSQYDTLNHNLSKNSLAVSNKANSNLHYQNLIQKKINTVFQLLDSDQDGVISPNTIGIQNLSKNILIFLKPIFQQMDQLDAQLNYNQFKKAVINLLNDSDPYKKGLFLSETNKKQTNQPTFAPKINEKSKVLAQGRSSNKIHIQLYEQGIKNQKRKEYMLQKQRARKQQRQLEQCSFKPCLHLGRKDYNPSILEKKLSQIEFSINQSSNQNNQKSSSQLNYRDDQMY